MQNLDKKFVFKSSISLTFPQNFEIEQEITKNFYIKYLF